MNTCKKKIQQIRNGTARRNSIAPKDKVSVCDVRGILGHSESR